jgi:hypothetical protein
MPDAARWLTPKLLAQLADVWDRGYQSAAETCPYAAPHSRADVPNPYRATPAVVTERPQVVLMDSEGNEVSAWVPLADDGSVTFTPDDLRHLRVAPPVEGTCGTCFTSGWYGSRTGPEHRHCDCGRPCSACPIPSGSRCTCGAGDHRPPGVHNIHCADPDASATRPIPPEETRP